jgi:drug/metabolite transporter (DMT)-like permease
MENSRVISRRVGYWQINEAFLAELFFLAVVVFWGVTYVFTKNALAVTGPFSYNSMRMVLGALLLATLAGRSWHMLHRRYAIPVLLTGTVLFLSYSTQAYGQQFTTVSKAGFLTSTYLIYVPFLSALLLSQRPQRSTLMGVILAFFGLVFLSFEGSLSKFSLSAGDGWVAASGVGWALYFVLLARYAATLNILLFSTLHIAVAAALSSAGWFMLEPITIPVSSGTLWLGILTTGLLIIGLGTSIHTWISQMTSPARIALIATMEPVFAALAGWTTGEPLTARLLIGGSLIFYGMIFAEMRHWRPKKHTGV